MPKKTFFIASIIILIVAYDQLSSFYTAIQQASPIIIHSKTSSTEADETIKSLFNHCEIEFQSTLVPEIYVRHSKPYQKTYFSLSHMRKPVHQSVKSLMKEFENSQSQKANDHIYYLLESPTLKTLKQLRLNIEGNVKSPARASAFDRLIPFLSIAVLPSSNRCELIQDFIIYTEDVFGGTGFLV